MADSEETRIQIDDQKYSALKEDDFGDNVSRNIRTVSGRYLPFPLDTESGYTCPICLETITDSSTLTILECRHGMCQSCLTQWLTSKITAGDINISCPVSNCGIKLSNSTISTSVSQDVAQKYFRFRELKSDPNLRDCPKCATLTKREGKENNVMKCPNCEQIFCFLHGGAHLGKTCDEFTRGRSGSTIQREEASEKYIAGITKKCPHCSQPIEKVKGTCSHVRCTNCGKDFCFKCLNINLTGKYHRKCNICNQEFIDHQYMPRFRIFFIIGFPIWFPIAVLWTGVILALLTCCCPCTFLNMISGPPGTFKGLLLLLLMPYVFVATYSGLTQCTCLMPPAVIAQMNAADT